MFVDNSVGATYRGRALAQMAEHLANDCLWEAKEYGITEADLLEAAGGDLDAYMLAELNRAVDHRVEDRQ